MLLQLPDNIKS